MNNKLKIFLIIALNIVNYNRIINNSEEEKELEGEITNHSYFVLTCESDNVTLINV